MSLYPENRFKKCGGLQENDWPNCFKSCGSGRSHEHWARFRSWSWSETEILDFLIFFRIIEGEGFLKKKIWK